MPVYDFICKICGKTFENSYRKTWEDVPECCSQPMERMFPVPTIKRADKVGGTIFPVGGVTIEHCAAEPVFFATYRDLKNYEKKHNMQIGA